MEYLNKNCSICKLECLKLGIGYVENNCVHQPTQNLTNCYCCKNITDDVCFLFKQQPCSKCREACYKNKINYNYCVNKKTTSLCYCCLYPLEHFDYNKMEKKIMQIEETIPSYLLTRRKL